MNESSRKTKMPRFLIALGIAMSLSFSVAARPPSGMLPASASPHAIADESIVVLRTDLPKPRVEPLARELATAHHGKLEKVWTAALRVDGLSPILTRHTGMPAKIA